MIRSSTTRHELAREVGWGMTKYEIYLKQLLADTLADIYEIKSRCETVVGLNPIIGYLCENTISNVDRISQHLDWNKLPETTVSEGRK